MAPHPRVYSWIAKRRIEVYTELSEKPATLHGKTGGAAGCRLRRCSDIQPATNSDADTKLLVPASVVVDNYAYLAGKAKAQTNTDVYRIQPVWIHQAERIIARVRIEVDTTRKPDGIGLREPTLRWVVEARAHIVEPGVVVV